jgi:hypothetical protein
MFERQERAAILLLVGIAVVVTGAHLFLSGLGKQPFARPFSPGSPDGELVFIEGQIDQLTLTKNGGHLIASVNNLSVFVPAQVAADISVKKGDRISVYGIVQTYHGQKEIVVSAPGDIRVTPAPSL